MPTTAQQKIVVYSHSMLFYWWPVWMTGFIMALVSYMSDQRLATNLLGPALLLESHGIRTQFAGFRVLRSSEFQEPP
jgi:hypothetical protein